MSNPKHSSKFYFYKIMIIDALALFAMFFGAGNMLFPLEVGVRGGAHFWLNWLGFILTGVGIPIIGLWANQLFKGSYETLFSYLGKIPKNIIIGLILLIIGPLFGGPRTETVTFASWQPFLPHNLWIHALVSAIFFLFIFLIALNPSTLVNIVGEILSPIKVIAFITLIVLSVSILPETKLHYHTVHHSFIHAMHTGYATMDLFSAIFFGSIVYLNVMRRSKQLQLTEKRTSFLAGMCSIIGMCILIVIYTGLMYAAHLHAHALQHVSNPQLIEALSDIVLGRYGAIFVAVCITLACLATAAALAEVTTIFFHKVIFQNKVARLFCLTLTVVWMYVMSLLGFSVIMAILTPILTYLYPVVAIYTFIMCIYVVTRKKAIKQA